jgi:hypothetical protein
MSYRDDQSYDPGTSRRSFWYWPALDSLDDSYSVARKSFGGWVFAGMVFLGAVLSYALGKSAVDLKTPESNVIGALVGSIIELLFVLFAAYRIRTGRGWVVSWFLLALFGLEAVVKVVSGGATVIGWVFLYLAVGSSILAGARACWDIRSRTRAGERLSSGEDLEAVFE